VGVKDGQPVNINGFPEQERRDLLGVHVHPDHVRVAGYVSSTPDFTGQSQVINGASDLFVDLFGEAGRHTRMAIGVSALPYDVAVEVEAVFEVS
jgi:enamine deaminase RidA (YjgF/YER057c/UK114 family)